MEERTVSRRREGATAKREPIERVAWFNVYALPYGKQSPFSRSLKGESDSTVFEVQTIEITFYEGIEDLDDNAEAAAPRERAAARAAVQARADRARLAALQAEADKAKAAERARAAEEQARVRSRCADIYRTTIDKKIKDLTVREEQQVRACQHWALYPPQ